MTATPAFHSLQRETARLGLPRGSGIVVAVSGGPDSVALLRTLLALAGEQQWRLSVGHVNHTLRGAESDADEAFVRALAAEWNLECRVAHVPTAAIAAEQRVSVEVAARSTRYDALERWRQEAGMDIIATGHTLDDQAETVLLNLLRGAGLRGLRAMVPRAGLLARPLLHLPRATILQALTEIGQDTRLDSSNRDLRFRRNQIRHRVLPVLAEIRNDPAIALARTASLLAPDADFLDRAARDLWPALDLQNREGEVSASIGVWTNLHPALRGRVVRDMVEIILGGPGELDASHAQHIAESIFEKRDLIGQLPHAIDLYADGPRFALRRGVRPELAPLESAHIDIPGTCVTALGSLRASLLTPEEMALLPHLLAVCGPLHALLDAEGVSSPLTVGPRRPGDRVRPVGAVGSRKLQDIFVDAKIPSPLRDRIPVIRSASEIVWIPGMNVAQSAAATVASRRVLHLWWVPEAGLPSDTIRRLFARR